MPCIYSCVKILSVTSGPADVLDFKLSIATQWVMKLRKLWFVISSQNNWHMFSIANDLLLTVSWWPEAGAWILARQFYHLFYLQAPDKLGNAMLCFLCCFPEAFSPPPQSMINSHIEYFPGEEGLRRKGARIINEKLTLCKQSAVTVKTIN